MGWSVTALAVACNG